jgi:hypothetical protein
MKRAEIVLWRGLRAILGSDEGQLESRAEGGPALSPGREHHLDELEVCRR